MSQSPVESKMRLPPGQVLTNGWPILHAGSVPNVSKESWSLKVHGEVQNSLTFDYEGLLKLKKTSQICDIHCVTTWSKFDAMWEGVRFKDLMQLAKPTEKARFAVFECEQGFTTNLPLEVLYDDDVLVAYGTMGKELPLEHGGPVRMLVPKRYFYKSAKWLRGIRLVEHDEPGFWEIRGYSNSADPWNEERYAGVSYADIVKNRLKAYARRK
ncbi:MAG: sulfite oxidase-like oxidoreductase [Thaumarchaeota archaeon]|nr:sulfite oxidase-like oxidoreductase [Nitrososphaerota archaeon]